MSASFERKKITNCGSCSCFLYRKHIAGETRMGECRRFPPQVVLEEKMEGKLRGVNSIWPLVLSKGFCFEYISREDEDDNES